MARIRGPKNKLSRREGVNLFGTTSPSLERRLEVPPGGRRRRGQRPSEYGARLRAKQRVKRQYGLLERQFRKLFDEAARMAGPAGANVLMLLERRLDNVVYRLGFARTRPMARQLVGHGHIEVNGKRVDIPSYRIRPGEEVRLKPGTVQLPGVQQGLVQARPVPPWLERLPEGGRVIGQPRREDVDADIREDYIVEFYAR